MPDYRERLYVPLAWWLLAVPTVLILGATVYAGLSWPWPVVIVGGLAAGCAALLIALGERQSTRLRGPRADPAAHLYSRPYLKESVYVATDPAVPATQSASAAPYWLIGTRHPAKLAAAIERCRVQDGHEPVA